MRKIRVLNIVLNSIIVLAFSVLIVYTSIRIDLISKSEYLLSKQYVKVNIYDIRPVNTNKNKELLMKIYDLCKDTKITILFDNIDSMGLAVFDTSNRYDNQKLTEGAFIKYNDIYSDELDILVKKDSFIYYQCRNNNGKSNLNSQVLNAVGTYDQDHILYSENKEYIYNFFKTTNLNGLYYIDSDKREITDEFIKIFTNNGYDTVVYRDGLPASLWDRFIQLLSDKTYFTALLGMAFIYINNFIFCKVQFIKLKKDIMIRFLFGAAKIRLYKDYLNYTLKHTMLGLFLGTLSYYIIFSDGNLSLQLSMIPIIWLFHCLFSIISLTIIYKMSIPRKEERII